MSQKIDWMKLGREPLSSKEQVVINACKKERFDSRCIWRWLGHLVREDTPILSCHFHKFIAHYVKLRNGSVSESECLRVRRSVYNVMVQITYLDLKDHITDKIKNYEEFKKVYQTNIGVSKKTSKSNLSTSSASATLDYVELARHITSEMKTGIADHVANEVKQQIQSVPNLCFVTDVAKQELDETKEELEKTQGALVAVNKQIEVLKAAYEEELRLRDSAVALGLAKIEDLNTKVLDLKSKTKQLEKQAARATDADERIKKVLVREEQMRHEKELAEKREQELRYEREGLSNQLTRELQNRERDQRELQKLKQELQRGSLTEAQSLLLDTIMAHGAGKSSTKECTGYEIDEMKASIDLYLQTMYRKHDVVNNMQETPVFESKPHVVDTPSNGNLWTGSRPWDDVKSYLKSLNVGFVKGHSSIDGWDKYDLTFRSSNSRVAQTHISCPKGKVEMSRLKTALNQLGGDALVEEFQTLIQGHYVM
jgi:hypothetical protein